MAGVTMALATYAIFVALIQFDNASGLAGLPNPSMTIDSNEKLLKLNCTPQASAIGSWNKVWDLFIFASVQGHANVTVAKLTDSEKGPELGGEFKTTAALLGGLLPKDSLKPFPYLSVYVVLQAANYGTYYCEIRHNTELTPNVDPTYSKKVIVRDTVTVTQGNIDDEFDAKLTTVTRVNITWQHPRLSTFTEARVTRTLVDSEGRETSPTESLAVVLGADVHKNPETALVVFQDHQNVQGHNYTLTAYVLPLACDGKPCPVQFSCYVPYKDCYGDSEQFCSCTPVSASISSGTVAGITVAAVLVFMAALLAGLLGLLVCCWRKGHCTKLPRALFRYINPERQTKSIETQVDSDSAQSEENPTTGPVSQILHDLNVHVVDDHHSSSGSSDRSIHRPAHMQNNSHDTLRKQPNKNAAVHSPHNTGRAEHLDSHRNSDAATKRPSIRGQSRPSLSCCSGSEGGFQDKPQESVAPVHSLPREAVQPNYSMSNATNRPYSSRSVSPRHTPPGQSVGSRRHQPQTPRGMRQTTQRSTDQAPTMNSQQTDV